MADEDAVRLLMAALLGRAQPSTTLDIYSHAFEKNKREASRAMQAGLEI